SKKLAIIYQIVFRNKSNYQNVIYNRSNREAENCYRGAHYWNRGTNCISNIDYTNSSLLIRKYDPLQNDGVYVLSYGLIQAEGSKPTYPFFDVSIEVTGIPYNLDEYVKNNIQLVISTSFVRSPLSQERNDNGQVYVVTSQTDQSEKKDYWMIARQDASIGYLYCGAPNSKDHFIQNHGIKLTFRIYLLTFDRKLYPVMTKEKTLHAVGTFKYSKTDPMYLLLFGTIICEANISSTLNASFNANILHSLSLYKQNNVILKESAVLDVTKRSEQTNLSKKLVHHFEIVLKDQNGTILGSMDSNWSRTFMNGTVNTTDYPDNISIDVDFKDGLEYIKIEAKYSLGNHKYLFHHKEIIYLGPNDPRTSKLSQRHHTSLEDLKKQEKITKTFTIPFLIIFSILSYVTLILYHVIQSITS
uniref:L-type lectin-like domain-containing protein n=1 Tax=Rhabditophanes sp. KR3021 TaxID=114890 RepID=A0AC35U1H8_9BILA